MPVFAKLISYCIIVFTLAFPYALFANDKVKIPILCYHNFSPTTPGYMNMTPEKFETEIKWLKDNGFTIVPLKEAVAYLQGQRESLPPKPVVITADDGWQSAYTYMYPIVKKYQIPVTLFIYPQTISEGKHAMTWAELKELQQTGFFDIQGHTYWHPNFKQEKRKLSTAAYQKLVKVQLVDSKAILENKMGTKITLLAWPYGIYDPYLEQQAANAGYTMAFSIDDRKATKTDRPMAQPRFMILEGLSLKTFANKMNAGNSLN
jgi:peptidoglycan/xylan/chitin deacetylase (PgdA/CDA1 family)